MTNELGCLCHLCGGRLTAIDRFADLIQVTSDCRPWRAGGRLGACIACGTVQKPVDAAWQAECGEIYASYAIYEQGSGAEQQVFDQASGAAVSRSSRLVSRLLDVRAMPDEGRLLDIGCGNGAFLSAFGRARPRWRLTGAEVSDTNRRTVEALPGVEAFHTGEIESLSGQFDVAVLVHCLEHIANPTAFLRRAASCLSPGGVIMVEVPNFVANPFDLLIADHCTHFTMATLRNAVAAAGLAIQILSDGWVPKELSLLAGIAPTTADAQELVPPADGGAKEVAWLRQLLAAALAEPNPVGIFGTSISGSWIAAQLGSHAIFFVDEDPHRIGKRHMGLPILPPSQAPWR